MVTSLSHSNHLPHVVLQGIYYLTTTAITSNAKASLDTIVWFKPTVPSLRAKHLLASHHHDILAPPTYIQLISVGGATSVNAHKKSSAISRMIETVASKKLGKTPLVL